MYVTICLFDKKREIHRHGMKIIFKQVYENMYRTERGEFTLRQSGICLRLPFVQVYRLVVHERVKL